MEIYPYLRKKMLDCGVSDIDLAELLNVEVSVITDKMRGVLPWYLHEALHVCIYLNTSELEKLFVRIDINT
jgi:hypothetical protein